MPEKNILGPRVSRIKNKIIVIIKLILSVFLFLVWFVFIQAEYEMITKPELQNDFPIIKGIYAVYLTGFILLVIASIIIFLLYSIKKSRMLSKKEERIQ
jgi:hypothetical protein